MHLRSVIAALLRIIAIFWGVLAILGFFALFGLAQVIPYLNILGGGISAIMALILGLLLFSVSYTGAELLLGVGRLEKAMEAHMKEHKKAE